MAISTRIMLDSATSDMCFSIRKTHPINGEYERRAFCPGEFDALKEYAPEFEAMAKAIWTPDVVAAWQQKQSEQEAMA